MRKNFEEMKEKKIPFTKYDFLILGIVLILVVTAIVVAFTGNQAPTVCKIFKDGKCVRVVNLKELGVSRVVEYNRVRIIVYADGVEVVHTDCYDEACMKSGKITKKGECIECAPSRIAVTLE